jgi:hypothetical protein
MLSSSLWTRRKRLAQRRPWPPPPRPSAGARTPRALAKVWTTAPRIPQQTPTNRVFLVFGRLDRQTRRRSIQTPQIGYTQTIRNKSVHGSVGRCSWRSRSSSSGSRPRSAQLWSCVHQGIPCCFEIAYFFFSEILHQTGGGLLELRFLSCHSPRKYTIPASSLRFHGSVVIAGPRAQMAHG